MLTAVLVGIGAIAGWLAKDLAGRFLARALARTGRIGYAYRECGFYVESISEDGRRFIGQYRPENMFTDEEVHYLRCSGDLYNDSDTAVLLTKPAITFWGPEGPVVRHVNPRLVVGSEQPTVLTVPSHGRQTITLVVGLFRDDLDAKYASTIPVVTFETVNGKKHEFRLAPTSFHGELTAWPRKGKFPILLVDRSAGEAETDEPPSLGAGDASLPTVDSSDRDHAV